MKYNVEGLSQLNKKLKIDQNVLSRNSLVDLKEYGCRILVICSSMFDEDENNLYVETNNGESELIQVDKLY